jgi:hypothetical protein
MILAGTSLVLMAGPFSSIIFLSPHIFPITDLADQKIYKDVGSDKISI